MAAVVVKNCVYLKCFAEDAAELVPHGAGNALVLVRRKLGQGEGEVFLHAGMALGAAQDTAERGAHGGGRPVHRHSLQDRGEGAQQHIFGHMLRLHAGFGSGWGHGKRSRRLMAGWA